MFLVLLTVTSACAGTTRSYRRVGTAGALTFLGGAVFSIAGSQVIVYKNEEVGTAVTAVGGVAQLTSAFLMAIALDGIMRKEAEREFGEGWWD